jgi:plasmid maintenance system antidote protein VapI
MSILEDMPVTLSREREPFYDGEKLRRALAERGMGSFELALKLHVSESLISKMMKGERQNPVMWKRAARALRMALRDLMVDEDGNGHK